jgi:hypothetical protein
MNSPILSAMFPTLEEREVHVCPEMLLSTENRMIIPGIIFLEIISFEYYQIKILPVPPHFQFCFANEDIS